MAHAVQPPSPRRQSPGIQSSNPHARCARLPDSAKAGLRIQFLAKHAASGGVPHETDGNHAVYHHELRSTLEGIGLDVRIGTSYDAIGRAAEIDFAIPLLNRTGFQNSEMLAPLLLARAGIPYLGASPILRGLADDKHLSKLAARHHGVPTADWIVCRRGMPLPAEPAQRAERLVVKPNASSASWGVKILADWAEVREHVQILQAGGHDVIVEAYKPLMDIAVPVVGGAGAEPWLLPSFAYAPDDIGSLRSYEEKRALVPCGVDPLVPIEDKALVAKLEAHTLALTAELWPFDYGRFEFRYDPETDDLSFMEVNLSCNLWSQKTISRSARTLGIDHATLVESIVAHSLCRQGVISADRLELAA